jgi:hypothetical protein
MKKILGLAAVSLAIAGAGCSKGESTSIVLLGTSGWHVKAPSGVESTANDDDFSYSLKDPAETSRSGGAFPFTGDPTEDAAKAACDAADPKVEKLGATGFVATCGEGKDWTCVAIVKAGDDAMQLRFSDSNRGSRASVRAVCASLAKK